MYIFTENGAEIAQLFIKNCKAKRKEILDAGLDTADDTTLPTLADILCDIPEFKDEEGNYYNAWGVTDEYNSDSPLELKENTDFVEAFVGQKVRLAQSGNLSLDDLNKFGTITKLGTDSQGNNIVDILIDGDDLPSVCFDFQVVAIQEVAKNE